MTVEEFYSDLLVYAPLKVISGYNGKVLCRRYNPDKHLEIGTREISKVYPILEIPQPDKDRCYTIMVASVSGWKEYEEEQEKKKNECV